MPHHRGPGAQPNPGNQDTNISIDALMALGLSHAQAAEILDLANQNGWSYQETINYIQANGYLDGVTENDDSASSSGYGGGVSFFAQMKEQYQQVARTFGITNLSNAQMRTLFKNHVSIQEFADRLTAVQRINEFKPAMREFAQMLKSRGIDGPNFNNDDAVLKFMLGQAPKKFYALYDEFNVGLAARQAGAHINQRLVRSIAKRLPGVQSEAEMQQGMQELANKIMTLLPLSKLHKYGLNKRQLATLQFGGPKQQQIADKVRRVLAQEQGIQEGGAEGVVSENVGAREAVAPRSGAPSF